MEEMGLCSNCETGKNTYELDRHSPLCPYISFHNGKECSMYKEMKKEKNDGIYKEL